MSIDELCALPVAELAAKDSALFMWATFPQLPEALRLIRAWGFTYKSVAFVWLKKNKKADSWFYGLGFWTRANAEVCLLATKGHPKRQAADIHQFIISPIEAHSKKPDETRDKIVALMGDRPRVEPVSYTHLCNISSLRRSLKWMKHTYCWKCLTREIAIFLKVQRLKYQRIQYLPVSYTHLGSA